MEYYAGRPVRGMGRRRLDEFLAGDRSYLIVMDDDIERIPPARRNVRLRWTRADGGETGYLVGPAPETSAGGSAGDGTLRAHTADR